MQSMFTRDSGIILHPTSLPGPNGIGDLGPEAYRWIDFLAGTGCGFWQVLPLGPTGYGDSPYQGFSAFAGNPYLVSPDRLLASGLLEPADLDDRPSFPDDHVDFGAAIPWKLQLLDRAFDRFRADPAPAMIDDLDAFAAAAASWLDDFSFFMALKADHGGGLWTGWPLPLVRREPDAIAAARRDLATEIQRHRFRQYLFFRQWTRLRSYAADRGVRIVGDAPIFVAEDSADVWAHSDLFFLDDRRRPEVVAGVPPDYFSATGQLWGNPLYDWERQRSDGYAWWIDRLRTVLQLVDVLRIDHFRGFVDYWEIPAGATTAVKGRWVDGPGEHFFMTIRAALGDLPIIAEDLGELHATVPALRDRLGLPGMKVVQFAFDGDPANEFLPDRYPAASVVYTGTHDNDTTAGWFAAASTEERARVLEYLDSDGADVVGDLLKAAWASKAGLAVAPLQDFMRLGSKARMNTPGRPDGNWSWRFLPDALTPALQGSIRRLNSAGGRTAH
jgi:4-alpha-glucanotransferase